MTTEAAGSSRLDGLERWMLGAILDDEEPGNVEETLSGGPRMTAAARLHIYRTGYRLRLVECLADDYPALKEALGEDGFDTLCRAYIEAYPSASPSLNGYGRHMSVFCRTYSFTEHPGAAEFFAELAALEWALVDVIHAPSPAALHLSALEAIPMTEWASVRLLPNDSVRLLHFQYPVNAYYQAFRKSEERNLPDPSPTSVAVYRQGTQLWRLPLTPGLAPVLAGLFEGLTIGEALSRLVVDESDSAAVAEAGRTVMVAFREWISSGFFAGLER